MNITQLALDGLSARHKVLSANIANSQTSDYTRSDVKFEDQLNNIISQEKLKEHIKLKNSGAYSSQFNAGMKVNVNVLPDSNSGKFIMSSNNYANYSPEVFMDTESPEITRGNNVNIEKEMVQLSKNGTKFTALAEIQSKAFRKMEALIKGASI